MSESSARVENKAETSHRRLTAKVTIAVVVLCGSVGALLGSVSPPDELVSRIYRAAYQPEPDKSSLAPPVARPVVTAPQEATPKPVSTPLSTEQDHVGEQSPVRPGPAELPASAQKPVADPPVEQRAAVDEATSAVAPQQATSEKPQPRPSHKAKQKATAPAKRKQQAAPPSAPAPTKQTPSIATRLSDQWWR